MIIFALQGDQITSHPFDVARIALPLPAYFAIMTTSIARHVRELLTALDNAP